MELHINVCNKPGINPDDTSLQIIHGETVGPAATARFFVDGAAAEPTHGGSFDPRHACIPVRPEENPTTSTGECG